MGNANLVDYYYNIFIYLEQILHAWYTWISGEKFCFGQVEPFVHHRCGVPAWEHLEEGRFRKPSGGEAGAGRVDFSFLFTLTGECVIKNVLNKIGA